MRILFVWPGIYLGWDSYGKGFEQSAINHGLSSISAVLKSKGHDCFLMDMRSFKGWDNFNNVLKKQKFDVAIIGFHSVDEKYADRAIRSIKRYFPNKTVIVGGVHITFNKIKKFSLADCVVWGEGDLVTADLVRFIENGKPIPEYLIADMITDLDLLPFVDRSLFNIAVEQQHPILPLLPVPFHTINFSRGCSYSCTYCLESKNILWKKYRARSPENCIEELRTLDLSGSIMIHDDHFPPSRWTEKFIDLWDNGIGKRVPFWCQIRADWICRNRLLIPDMARIGMTWVSLGIEGSQRMLDFYNKKLKVEQVIEAANILHENKVNIFGNYIVGAPTETKEDIDELERILEKVRPEFHSASIYTSYSGSKLYDYIEENDLWVGDDVNDPNNHYSMQRFPYERKIKGIDYNKLKTETIPRLTRHRSEMKVYD